MDVFPRVISFLIQLGISWGSPITAVMVVVHTAVVLSTSSNRRVTLRSRKPLSLASKSRRSGESDVCDSPLLHKQTAPGMTLANERPRRRCLTNLCDPSVGTLIPLSRIMCRFIASFGRRRNGRPIQIHVGLTAAVVLITATSAQTLPLEHVCWSNAYALQNRNTPENRPTRVASGTLIPAEACRLRGHGQCLERREETTSLSSGTAGLVAAAHPASDPCPPGNRRRVPESGGDCGASAQWLGAVRTKTGQRSDHRLRRGKTGHPSDARSPRP
jgi:hypothetical protein